MSMSSSSEITIKNGNSLLMNFIQRVSHPTKMAPCQKVALTTFSGGATGAIAFGVALGFGAAVIMSAGIAAIAALVVMVAIAILISKRELSPEEAKQQFLQLNESREQAGVMYIAALSVTSPDVNDLKEKKRFKDKYVKLIKQQIAHSLQQEGAFSMLNDRTPVDIPSRKSLENTLQRLTEK